MADTGDVNADGYADVVIGAPQNDAGGQDAGRAYVYSGKDGSILLTLSGEAAGDQFGAAVAGARRGDRLFILVGAPNAGPNHTGRTYVYEDLTGKPAFVIESDDTGAQLGGMFISVVGDVDGDGSIDLLVTSAWSAVSGTKAGRVFVISSRGE